MRRRISAARCLNGVRPRPLGLTTRRPRSGPPSFRCSKADVREPSWTARSRHCGVTSIGSRPGSGSLSWRRERRPCRRYSPTSSLRTRRCANSSAERSATDLDRGPSRSHLSPDGGLQHEHRAVVRNAHMDLAGFTISVRIPCLHGHSARVHPSESLAIRTVTKSNAAMQHNCTTSLLRGEGRATERSPLSSAD